MRVRSLFALLALLAGLLSLAGVAAATPPVTGTVLPSPAGAVAGQYVVVLAGSVPARDVRAAAAALAARSHGTVVTTYSHALRGFAVRTTPAGAKTIAGDARVRAVQQDARVRASAVQPVPAPPDTYWGLDRIDQRTLPVDRRYSYNNTAAGVHAYVIDTGIFTGHSQFAPAGRAVFSFTAPGLPSPGADCHGHGTHVAGTIGGLTYGVAKAVRLHAVKVLDCAGSGTYAQVIAGVDWVTANAVKPAVANMSLGGPAFPALDLAVHNSIESGVTYTLAAGNSNADACDASPARTLSAITVGATGNRALAAAPVSDIRADFSNFGACLDLFAPGALIRSSFIGSPTAAATLSGTSMAAPHAAGVAARYLAEVPAANPLQVRNYLVAVSTKSLVLTPGAGSPNRLLFAGAAPRLTLDVTPEPVRCRAMTRQVGGLSLGGTPLGGKVIEMWFDPAGPVGARFQGSTVTNVLGVYVRAQAQSVSGTWIAVWRGQPLIPAVAAADAVTCV